MNNVTALNTRLQADTNAGKLIINQDNFDIEGVIGFINSLPARQLLFSQPNLQLDEANKKLTISGQATESWPIIGLNGKTVEVNHMQVIVTEESGLENLTVAMQINGIITVGIADLTVAGQLIDDHHVRFQLSGLVDENHLFTDIAQVINPNGLVNYLPDIDLFNKIPFSAFSVAFGFSRQSITTVSFTSNINTDWQIIDKIAAVKQIGVTINSNFQFSPGGFVHSFSGDIHGVLKIVEDFSVKLALKEQDDWEVEVIPSDGNVLPAFGALFGLIGGSSVQQEFEQGLSTLGLGAVAIDDIKVGFSIQSKAIKRIFILGHIILDQIRFDISLLLPTLEIHGSLSPTTPIHLKALADKHLPSGSIFPVVDIESLDISARIKDKIFSLSAYISSDFQIAVAHLAIGFKDVNFEIRKTPEGATGFIDATISIADYDFSILAQHLDANGGWHFEGQTDTGEDIPIGTLIQHIATQFKVDQHLPDPIKSLTVKDLFIAFDTKTKDFTYKCTCDFTIDGKQAEIKVDIELRQQDNFYTKSFKGIILIDKLEFDVIFSQDLNATAFIASYKNLTGGEIPIVWLVESVTDSEAILSAIENIKIDLKDALFSFYKTDTTKFLFAIDLGVGIDLSNLPLVGKLFPPRDSLKLMFQPLVASANFAKTPELDQLSTLIPAGGTSLPQRDIEGGFGLSASMKIADLNIDMSLPVSMDQQGQLQNDTNANTGGGNTPAPAAGANKIRWFNVQKKLGPVYFEKVGMQYQNSELSFLLSASLTLGPLSVSLNGLGAKTALQPINPSFFLNGLAIEYKSDALEIGGAFLKNPTPPDNVNFEYDGAALIKTSALTLSALGSYAQLKNGHPSLFIYAVLDYPLGGPAFFFVTGLAAGFGYNRGIKTPNIEQVATFPLVSDVVSGAAKAASGAQELTNKLNALAEYIPPMNGQYFLAVGIKFNSFKLIDSFALLTVSFGQHFEIDLLGLSTLVIPTEIGAGIDPLAEVQMALKASFIPDEGFLGIEARLTNASYILSKNCHLTGGFAFYSWFDGPHRGDFALTLGGYHKSFKAPAHYPQVPRVGFNWQIDSKISIKGDMYFALVPSAVMAGGHLKALWDSGDLKAWFMIGADFLISWKPYHYDAELYLDMGVSYTFNLFGRHTIKVEVGADLHIWGPDFSGTAAIHLWIISFDVTFGAAASQTPEPIGWQEFKTSFLPKPADICSITVQDGLIRKSGSDSKDLGVVNPKELVLITNSVIPSKTASSPNTDDFALTTANTDFGIAPMAVSDLDSNQKIEITVNNNPVKDKFIFEPLFKEAPAGLWSKKVKPDLNGKKIITNTLAGYKIHPGRPQEPDVTQQLDRKNFAFETDPLKGAYHWSSLRYFESDQQSEKQHRSKVRNSIATKETITARAHLLKALKMDKEVINIKPNIAGVFIIAPDVGERKSHVEEIAIG